MRPQRRQPTRLPCPWDSPGKNTGVGCHFLLQCMKVKSQSEVAQSCLTQRPHGLQPTRLLRPQDFLGKSTGVGCHCLLWPSGSSSLKLLLLMWLPYRYSQICYNAILKAQIGSNVIDILGNNIWVSIMQICLGLCEILPARNTWWKQKTIQLNWGTWEYTKCTPTLLRYLPATSVYCVCWVMPIRIWC